MSKVGGVRVMQSGRSAGIALESCQWFVPVRTCRTGLSTYRTGLKCMYCGAKLKWAYLAIQMAKRLSVLPGTTPGNVVGVTRFQTLTVWRQ